MLACYLDGKIFEFIQANRGNEIIDKFANELVEELGEQFNLTRQL
jgi:aminopeptidase-like protein